MLLLEHERVYTAGKRTEPHERPFDGTPVIDVDRGGKITWHGPGQLVGYPIVRLPAPVDVVAYVRRLEEMMIRVCADLGLAATRVEGRSGVWVAADAKGPDRKIGAIGIRVSRDVTMHGFALNCDCDLSWAAGHRALRHRRRRRHLAEPGARPRRDRRRGAALRREAPHRHPRLISARPRTCRYGGPLRCAHVEAGWGAGPARRQGGTTG